MNPRDDDQQTYLWLVGNGGMGYDYNYYFYYYYYNYYYYYYYYHSSIPYEPKVGKASVNVQVVAVADHFLLVNMAA